MITLIIIMYILSILISRALLKNSNACIGFDDVILCFMPAVNLIVGIVLFLAKYNIGYTVAKIFWKEWGKYER